MPMWWRLKQIENGFSHLQKQGVTYHLFSIYIWTEGNNKKGFSIPGNTTGRIIKLIFFDQTKLGWCNTHSLTYAFQLECKAEHNNISKWNMITRHGERLPRIVFRLRVKMYVVGVSDFNQLEKKGSSWRKMCFFLFFFSIITTTLFYYFLHTAWVLYAAVLSSLLF